MYKIFLGSFLILGLLSMFSCSSKKQIKYFDDLSDTAKTVNISKVNYTEPLIQIDDILNVTILTLDPNATQIINAGNLALAGSAPVGGGGNGAIQTANGYLVNKDGIIDLPILGKIKVVGLTTSQARETIEEKSKTFFKDPSVSLRITNFKITIAGEVARPSTYIVPNEKVTILDALGMAGDLTIYGKRENVLLIRMNQDGSKQAHRLDLSKSSVLNSPYYYLKQNDYLYVEPAKTKIAAADAASLRTITIIGSFLSFIAIIITRIK